MFQSKYGYTKISDQGHEIVNRVSQDLFALTKTNHRISTTYHPQTNGLVERFNLTIQRALLKLVKMTGTSTLMTMSGDSSEQLSADSIPSMSPFSECGNLQPPSLLPLPPILSFDLIPSLPSPMQTWGETVHSSTPVPHSHDHVEAKVSNCTGPCCA